jgi:hypothetical protein
MNHVPIVSVVVVAVVDFAVIEVAAAAVAAVVVVVVAEVTVTDAPNLAISLAIVPSPIPAVTKAVAVHPTNKVEMMMKIR